MNNKIDFKDNNIKLPQKKDLSITPTEFESTPNSDLYSLAREISILIRKYNMLPKEYDPYDKSLLNLIQSKMDGDSFGGASDEQVLFMNGATISGDDYLVYDYTNNILKITDGGTEPTLSSALFDFYVGQTSDANDYAGIAIVGGTTGHALLAFGNTAVANRTYFDYDVSNEKLYLKSGYGGYPIVIDNQYKKVGINNSSPSVSFDVAGEVLVSSHITSTSGDIKASGSNVLSHDYFNFGATSGSGGYGIGQSGGNVQIKHSGGSWFDIPAGNDTEIQFNNSGLLGANSQFTVDTVEGRLASPIIISQNIYGSLTSGQNLNLYSNIAHDGKVYFNDGGTDYYNEDNNTLFMSNEIRTPQITTTPPTAQLSITGNDISLHLYSDGSDDGVAWFVGDDNTEVKIGSVDGYSALLTLLSGDISGYPEIRLISCTDVTSTKRIVFQEYELATPSTINDQWELGTIGSSDFSLFLPSNHEVLNVTPTTVDACRFTFTDEVVINGALIVGSTTISGSGGGVDHDLLNNLDFASAGHTGQLPLANGGTNGNLTAVDNGIVYSTSSAFAITSAPHPNGGVLVVGPVPTSTPTWTLVLGGNFGGTGYGVTSLGDLLVGNGVDWTTVGIANYGTLVSNGAGAVSWATTANDEDEGVLLKKSSAVPDFVTGTSGILYANAVSANGWLETGGTPSVLGTSLLGVPEWLSGNDSVLVTSAAGEPELSTTLPDGLTLGTLGTDWDIGNGRMIQADKIQARDADGLALYEDGGKGAFIQDSTGWLGIGGLPSGIIHAKSTTNNTDLYLDCTAAGKNARVFFINPTGRSGSLIFYEGSFPTDRRFNFGHDAINDDFIIQYWTGAAWSSILAINRSTPNIELLNNVIIGNGTAETDYTLTFDGQSNDGIITWMEDEDYFKFSDDILMNSTERIYLRDTALSIASLDDGHLDLTADASIDVNGLMLTQNVQPLADDTYYLGKNDDDSPLAYKGVILKDQTTGTYYRLQIDGGAINLVDLTD